MTWRLLTVLGALAHPTTDDVFEILSADGTTLTTAQVVLDANSGLTYSRDQDVVTIPNEQLLRVQFPRPSEQNLDWNPSAAVHYHDGSFLVGRVVGGDDAVLRWQFPQGLVAELPIDALQVLFLGAQSSQLDPGQYPIGAETDAIFRNPESGGDFTTGAFLAFGEDEFQFEYSLGEGAFGLEEIEAVTLAMQWDLPKPEGLQVAVDLWPDGVMKGELLQSDQEGVHLLPLFADRPVVLPTGMVRSIRYPSRHALWLSDLTPKRVVERPFLGPEEFFLYPHRVDRSVTGRPLQIVDERFSKGFGCHSQTRLTFALDGLGASRFRARVGVAEEVRRLADPGAIEFAVLIDDKEIYRSDVLHAGDRAVAIPDLDIAGANTLTLLTDFGAHGDIADRGVWADPILWMQP